jgi:serine protease inhibitor
MAVAVPTSQIIFSCRLLQQLLRRNEENVFISPAGTGLALGMVAAGAEGQTLAALEHVLGVDAKLAASRAKRLFASLDTLPPGLAVHIANSLWAASGVPLAVGYVAAVIESYRSQARNVDFMRPGTVTLINDWVARATHGQIRDAINQIDPSSPLVLVNAIYFYGPWQDPFDPNDTLDHKFTIASGGITQVRLMSKRGEFDYADNEDLQAIRLPYKHGRFDLLVVLPREPIPAAAFDEIAKPNSLARILSTLEERSGTFRMPKVRLTYAADLTAELSQMGMAQAFASNADFTGLFNQNIPAFISAVATKTRLEIDEKGTTASASTVVEMSLSASISEPSPPFEMTVDRPFLIVLTEKESDLILFIGVIGDPTATAPSYG